MTTPYKDMTKLQLLKELCDRGVDMYDEQDDREMLVDVLDGLDEYDAKYPNAYFTAISLD